MVDQWLSDCGPRYVNLSTAACELHAGLSLDLRLSHRSMKDAVYLYICKCVRVCVCACVRVCVHKSPANFSSNCIYSLVLAICNSSCNSADKAGQEKNGPGEDEESRAAGT